MYYKDFKSQDGSKTIEVNASYSVLLNKAFGQAKS